MTDFIAMVQIELGKKNYEHWKGFHTLLGQALMDYELEKDNG